jgi:hypothetical protein
MGSSPLGSHHHFLPRQGKPRSNVEHVTQFVVRALAWLPVYIAVVVTIILFIEIFRPGGWR